MVHELGSDRCKTGRSLSTVNKLNLDRALVVVREDPARHIYSETVVNFF